MLGHVEHLVDGILEVHGGHAIVELQALILFAVHVTVLVMQQTLTLVEIVATAIVEVVIIVETVTVEDAIVVDVIVIVKLVSLYIRYLLSVLLMKN